MMSLKLIYKALNVIKCVHVCIFLPDDIVTVFAITYMYEIIGVNWGTNETILALHVLEIQYGV